MTAFRKLCSLLFCFSICSVQFLVAQSNWSVTPTVSSDKLLALHFFGSSFGIAAGENNMMIRTINGGSSWSQISPQPCTAFRDVWLASNTICYAVGDAGKIEKSTSGGNGWLNQVSGVTDTLYGVNFINTSVGFVCGDSGTVLSTVNGGTSWTALNVPVSVRLYDIVFTSAMTGFACGMNGTIIKTADGGTNWQTLNSSVSQHLHGLAFRDSLNGFACGENGTILKTIDGGQSWTPQTSHITATLYDIKISGNAGNIIAVGEDEWCVHSVDNGITWQLMIGASGSAYAIEFTTSSLAFATGEQGMILQSVTGWGRYNNSNGTIPYLAEVFFTDSLNGFAVGLNVIMHTTDGVHWDSTSFSGNLNFVSIHFPDANTGYAGTDANVLYKTIDAGATWQQIASPPTTGLHAVYFITPDTGFVCAYNVFRTTNGGATWDTTAFIDHPGYDNITGMTFPTRDSGYCVNDWGSLYRSTDGGMTWRACFVQASQNFSDISFPSANVGYIAESMHIYKTIDAGRTWLTVTPAQLSIVNDVYFPTEQVGYVAGKSSSGPAVVLKTTNGGLTWSGSAIPSSGSSEATSVFFPDERHGYATSYDVAQGSVNVGAYHCQDHYYQPPGPTLTDPSIRGLAPDWDWATPGNVSVVGTQRIPMATFRNGETVAAGTYLYTTQVGTTVFTTADFGGCLVRFDSLGNILWAYQVVEFTVGAIRDIACDTSGNTYVTGYFGGSANFVTTTLNTSSSGDRDIFVAKFSPSGSLIWVKQYGSVTQNAEHGTAIAVKADQSVIVSGWAQVGCTFGAYSLVDHFGNSHNYFVLALSSAGVESWVVSGWTGGSINYADPGIYKCTSDQSGNVYICGTFNDSIGFGSIDLAAPSYASPIKCCMFVAKFNPAGQIQWLNTAGGLDHVLAYSLAVDNTSGAVYVGGSLRYCIHFGGNTYASAAAGTDHMIVKYSSGGTIEWIRADGVNGSGEVYDMKVGSDQNVYVGGHLSGYPTFSDTTFSCNPYDAFYVASYSPAGQCLWVKPVVSPTGAPYSGSRVHTLDLDTANNIYIYATALGCTIDSTYVPGLLRAKLKGQSSTPTGITNISQPLFNFSVYPNPSNGVTFIQLECAQEDADTDWTYTIVNELGQCVGTGTLQAGMNAIDVNGITSGYYFITVCNGQHAGTKSFVKTN